MAYADLKNDVVFRKVFGEHPRVLAGLLNDLLGREGDRAIVELEYLPSELASVNWRRSSPDGRAENEANRSFEKTS